MSIVGSYRSILRPSTLDDVVGGYIALDRCESDTAGPQKY